ncbi:MAG: YidC/Oxa1 family membrane protein insertase [bacterium]|nr:YidC/Oxa1 family membrane protein insertase [bacterium]
MNQIFAVPHDIILQSLIYLYSVLFENFGLAIIALTVLIRALLLPFTLPASKTQKKMMDLKPRLDELKATHGKDKKKLSEEQLKLYQEHGINPLGGCLPQIVQIILLIILYNVFISFLSPGEGVKTPSINGNPVNTAFLWWDLAKKDPFYALPLIAGLSQFIMSKMIIPTKKLSIKKNDSKDEKKEKEDFSEVMQEVQGQMVYMMPVMTVFFSINFPSGLSLYWIVGNICSIIQQYFISGWGGLSELAFWNKKKQ